MSAEAIAKGEVTLLRQARDKFVAAFNREPVAAACAPGRVNLIGEHIDYCEGYVLPVALPFVTLIVGALNGTGECRVISVLGTGEELQARFPAPTEAKLTPGEPAWANYVKGVVANFPGSVRGFDAVIVSDVPIGAGLSSSAAIEVTVFTLLEALTGINVGFCKGGKESMRHILCGCDALARHRLGHLGVAYPTPDDYVQLQAGEIVAYLRELFDTPATELVEKAKLCQKAEHEFPGMPCGIMDQYVVTMAKRNHALLIDCRSLESQQIPMELGDLAVLVTNSNVKHQLTGSEYPQRRAQCQEAADRLHLPSLRGAKIEDLEKLQQSNCDDLVIKRARHVIEEIHRTEEVAKLLKEKNFIRVGELFYQSHDSLSQLMQVSCPELDQLVGIMRGAPGVYGARMTGGGFGGCVVTLVRKSEVDSLKARILAQYQGSPVFFVCQPSDGARLLKL